MSGTDLSVIRRRKGAYAATFVILAAAYFPLKHLEWQISDQFHTLMECAATMLSLCVGALALVRFYSRKDNTFLFIGTGFFITGLLDGYHGMVTAGGFRAVAPHFPVAAIAWSWLGSRLFLSLQLWLSWLFWKREQRLGEAGRISAYLVYAAAGAGFLCFFAFFVSVPSLAVYHEDLFFPRPLDLVPAALFLSALTGYLGKGRWRSDPFEHWMILGLIAGLMGQGLFMSSSAHIGDVMFTAAHVLKIASYLCALIGLLAGMHRLYSESLARQELALKNIILTTQQETSPDAMLVVDEDDRILSYNHRFVELWGLPEEMVRRRDDRPVLAFVSEKVRNTAAFVGRVQYLYEHRSEESVEEIELKDGRIIDRYSAPMMGADGKYYGRVWYFRDVTEKKRVEQNIRESEEKFRGLVDQSLVGIALIEDGGFSYVNRRFAAIFGYEVYEMTRLTPVDIAAGADKPIVMEALRRQLHPDGEGDEFTFRGLRKSGAMIEIEGRSTRMHVGGKLVLMVVVLDVTKRIRAEREVQMLQSRLREQAIRDPLTGLYNRRYLAEALKDELTRAARGGYPVSLVMGDIDHFKVINDTYGHLAGDEILKTFSTLIKSHCRSSDIGCRYGGEEFLLVLPGMARVNAAERTEALRLAFAAARMSHDGSAMRATASFGLAAFPGDGRDADELIAAADAALYAAKNAGRNRVMTAQARQAQGEAQIPG